MFVFTIFFNYCKMFIKNLKFVLRKACPNTEWTLEYFKKR